MKNVYEFPQQDNRYDEASLWIAKVDKGLTQADENDFREWLLADPENQALLFVMAKLWDKMGALNRLSELFPDNSVHRAGSAWPKVAAAASLVIAVMAGMWFVNSLDTTDLAEHQQQASMQPTFVSNSEAIFETAVGEQSTVVLSDGTKVVLNTNSLIEALYSDDRRLLRMERGEIHVDVAEDKSRPLVVIAGENIVQAVGTSFSLEISGDHQVELVVTEGRVLVGLHEFPGDLHAELPPIFLPPSSVSVAAGEEFVLGSNVKEIIAVSPEEIEVKLSWREGNLVFRGESLEEAVSEIGRYTTVQFIISDENLKRKTIGGRFRAGDVDGLLAALRQNFAIKSERTEDGKVLLSSL